jgi:hypothetical protein
MKPSSLWIALAPCLLTCQTSQPSILCAVSIGSFAVKYTLTEGAGACATLTTGKVGVESYLAGMTSDHPEFQRPVVALRAEEMGLLIKQYGARVAAGEVASTAAFADDVPGDDGFCRVGPPSAASLKLDAVPPPAGMATPGLPAVDVSYEWQNVRFYVTTSSIGAQLSADLVYRKDGCTARYHVAGLFPAISCKGTKMTPEGPMPVKDEGLCSPCSDPSVGRSKGSGIHPDVETFCDERALLCLPKGEPPSLKPDHYVCPAVTGAPPPN